MTPKQVKASLLTRPKRVALVALGPSFMEFFKSALPKKGQPYYFDEVWTVNRGAAMFRHDKLFCMDDLKWIENQDPAYGNLLRAHDRPIITSTIYKDYPMAVEYPLDDVLEVLGDDLLNNTCCYAAAFAIWAGVEELSIYGADFFYKNAVAGEEGGQALSYILGMFKAHKMTFRIPQASTLLSAHTIQQKPDGSIGRPLYGYHRKDPDHKENDPQIFWNSANPNPAGMNPGPDGQQPPKKEPDHGPKSQSPRLSNRRSEQNSSAGKGDPVPASKGGGQSAAARSKG